MKGIAIFSGVNYSGKGITLELISELVKENKIEGIKIASVSALTMKYMGLTSHQELGAAEPIQRAQVRQKVLTDIATYARDNAIFLDGHFIFEDGELTDFTPLCESTKAVVLIKPDPEIIVERAIQDTTLHPGRIAVRNIELVRNYINSDTAAALDFIDSTQNTRGYKPNLVVVRNNTSNFMTLREEVAQIFPEILAPFLESRVGVEGRSRFRI
jgi:adenylate kinase